MHKKNAIALGFVIIFTWVKNGFAQMQSEIYHISTSVISAGGGQIRSFNFQTNPTISQPSPILDGSDNPVSENYENYPGFSGTPQRSRLSFLAMATLSLTAMWTAQTCLHIYRISWKSI